MFRGIYHDRHIHQEDLLLVLERAWNHGLSKIIITGTSLQESQEALSLSEADSRLYCTIGVHPTKALEWQASSNFESYFAILSNLIEKNLSSKKILAIGEFGLGGLLSFFLLIIDY